MTKEENIDKEQQRICTDEKCRQFGCTHHGEHDENEYCEEQCDHSPESKCEKLK